MRTVAIIQARIGSTRLPGKVLKRLGRHTVLGHVVRRVRASRRLDAVIVATTTREADAAVAAEAERYGATPFRGSEDDVLGRYREAARTASADLVVRVTGDCPLYDPGLLDRMLAAFSLRSTDYLGNTVERTFPRGLDTEIFTAAVLAEADREATERHQREHVTPFIYEHPDRFRIASFRNEIDLSDLRLTLDTEEDWRLLQAIQQALGGSDDLPDTDAVVRYLRAHPEVARINSGVRQKPLRD